MRMRILVSSLKISRLYCVRPTICITAPREQEIISLKFDAELTNREIADILKTSEVNVRVTIFRALRKLRARMEQQQEAH